MPLTITQRERSGSTLTGNHYDRIATAARPHTDDLSDGEAKTSQETDHSSSITTGHNPSQDLNEHQLCEDTVLQLARTYTAGSRQQNPFSADDSSPLNPQSPNFNAREWARAMYNISLQDSDPSPATVGIAFQDLGVHGYGTATAFQTTVGNVWLKALSGFSSLLGKKGDEVQILQGFEGVIRKGEMLCVLGPPGSGCSTLLKTIAGETHGFYVDPQSYVNYQGIGPKEMASNFRGEAIYTAEIDSHIPTLSVGDTLYFAALSRAPKIIPGGVSKRVYAEHLRSIVMAMFGISHTTNTRVGDNFVRGVSGGERKRVSIAEAVLSNAPLQCWDNSTRGLDSANAIEFCKTLRIQAEVFGTTSCVALYQAPQQAYDVFDKVILLYEGRQIFFGRTSDAKGYFEARGFVCADSQTTADFLTSMTSPKERIVRPGFEDVAPRTSSEFAAAWGESEERKSLLNELSEYKQAYPFHVNGEAVQAFTESRQRQQAKSQRSKSPYTLSYLQQVQLCLWRGFRLLKGDPSITIFQLGANFVQFLIVSSLFYNLPPDTNSLLRRAMLIFVVVVLTAFSSILEILSLYAKRHVVEKHNRYALYHPSAEAIAAIITDLPYKLTNCIVVNITVYFMTNLNRTAGSFFFFLLVSFFMTLAMSMLFRFIGSATRTESQALAPTSILLLGIILYSGFAIPAQFMLGWASWIRRINVVSYAYESLLLNELHGRQFSCSQFIPTGPDYDSVNPFARVCLGVGAVPGSDTISGSRYLSEAYGFSNSSKWRNLGIIIVFMVVFMACYLITCEVVAAARSKGEVLVFQRGRGPTALTKGQSKDIESQPTSSAPRELATVGKSSASIAKQTSVFHWRDVCYDIKIKNEQRRILDHVDGWVKPGTLTALMGVSGAGKTTLLDTLASRITMGVIIGDILVDGKLRGSSFQRNTGYVQQQDLHLSTTTVREALVFSALLRQPASTPYEDKIKYTEEVLDLLEMREYADAVVGELGEGLNVEQRKRLTIAVELAAKPEVLLFLDEPTSGLDSQTSWSICDLMEKLVKHGQAILCTIHQPSAMLFQRFDRLLLLAKGGRTVYFGDIGKGSKSLVDYFTKNGAEPCPQGANPAEWMLGVIGAAPGTDSLIDWPQIWNDSPERSEVRTELDRLEQLGIDSGTELRHSIESQSEREFSASLLLQIYIVTKRVFQQYYRTPSYIYSKAFLCIFSSIFIGFSFFQAKQTQQGMRNQVFGIFALLTIFMQLVEQIIPFFVTQRSLYEVRERPSKTYSWKAFMVANIVVEIPWNTLMGIIVFLCWWFPIGLDANARYSNAEHSRGTLAFLFVWTFMLLCSTFAHLMIAGITKSETACNIGNVFAAIMLLFCGIVSGPKALPGFWVFAYRTNPFTYLVEGLLGVGLANIPITCSETELLQFEPANNNTCGEYMSSFIAVAGGTLLNPDTTDTCRYCALSNSDTFLSSISVSYDNRWRDWGLMWVFILFNVAMAIFLYWLMRVPKDWSRLTRWWKKI